MRATDAPRLVEAGAVFKGDGHDGFLADGTVIVRWTGDLGLNPNILIDGPHQYWPSPDQLDWWPSALL